MPLTLGVVLEILTAFFLWIAELAASIIMPIVSVALASIPGMDAEMNETALTWLSYADVWIPISEALLLMGGCWTFTTLYAAFKLFVKIFLPSLG